MLEILCNAFGVSGADEEVKQLIIKEISPFCEKIEMMRDGNIIAYKKGRKTPAKKLMVSAHTDEVGFMVKDITADGFLKFEAVGGIDQRILLSEKVFVGDNKIPGIIGIKAVHMVSKEEREKVVEEDQMYIDIGANSKEDALKYVNYGDYIAFDSKFEKLSVHRVKGKALDNRVGVCVLIRLIKSDCEYDFIACFNSLEEIGIKGAVTAAYKVKPDVALILEGTTCSDVLNTLPHEQSTRLGNGVALSIHDRGSYSNKQFNQFIINLAQEKNLKFQYKRTTLGGNDAGAIQLACEGVKTAVLSVPVRYIHSPVSIMDLRDYEDAYKLAYEVINKIGVF